METVTVLPHSRPLSRADLDQLPADGHRYELVDGTLIVTPEPSPRHQFVLGRLYLELTATCPPGLRVAFAPLDVALAEDTVLQPDLLVARDTDFTAQDLQVAPLLAVEVLSPSTRLIDLNLKRARYEAAGCPAYWVIDPDAPSLTVWELRDDECVEVAHVLGDQEYAAVTPYPVTVIPSRAARLTAGPPRSSRPLGPGGANRVAKRAMRSDMPAGPVDELLNVAVERPALDQFEVEVGRTLENRVLPGLTGDHREERHLDAVDQTCGHQRPVHRQAALRAQRHLGLLLEPGDDVDGVAAHDRRVRPVERSLQRGRHHRCRQAPHPGDPWVTHLGLLGARGQHLRKRPIRVGPEDHPLLLAVQGEAVLEQLGALLAPVAGPVAAGGAEAVELEKTSKV